MSAHLEQPLPDYESPPVIEVVIGAQFTPIPGFLPTHQGLFWQLVRDEYPRVEAVPPLIPTHENFEPSMVDEPRQVEFHSAAPIPRLFLIDTTDSWLIQLQPDRLLQNWRKVGATDSYPRYLAVRNRFDSALATLQNFCITENLPPPVIDQLETTYINHIPVGTNSITVENTCNVFPDFTWQSRARFLPPPESVGWKMTFVMPNRLGRLYVSVRRAIRKSDNIGVILCELTVRGRPAESTPHEIATWYDMAREWIVRSFADLVNDDFQMKHWGRKA